MKTPFIKFTIAGSFLLICAFFYSDTKSCGPDLELDATRFALFRNNLLDEQALEPFYYSERFMNSYESDPAKNDYNRNCNEWLAFTNNSVPAADIYTLQYKTSPEEFLQAYNTNNWKPLAQNGFAKWLLQKQHHASLAYFVLAKQEEFSQSNNFDPWETGINEPPKAITEIFTTAIAETHSTIPEFLKERYAFQAVKEAYYTHRRNQSFVDSAVACYDHYLKNSKSVVADWATLYFAGLQRSPIQQTYFQLQAFNRSDEKKVFVYQNISLKELKALELVTKNRKTLALINAVRAMKNPGRANTEIAAVYRNDPQSKYLPLLVTREINKLEDWLSSWQQLGFNSSVQEEIYNGIQYKLNPGKPGISYEIYAEKNRKNDKSYLNYFVQQLQRIKGSGKRLQSFYLLAQAHLLNMDGAYTAANNLCLRMQTTEPAFATQWLIEKTISLVNTKNILLPSVKADVASNVQELSRLNPELKKKPDMYMYEDIGWHDQTATAETSDDLAELMLLISNRYRKLGDILTAGLIYHSFNPLTNHYDGWYEEGDSCSYNHIAFFDRYAAPEDIDKLLVFKHQKAKTAFEKLITPDSWAKDDFYKDLKGTLLFRKKQYKEALAVYKTMEDTFWRGNYAYSIFLWKTSVKLTRNLVPGETVRAANYTYESKKLIAQDFVQLLDSIQISQNVEIKAGLLYQLGNAYFNTSYYGKDWMMFSYGKSQWELEEMWGDNYKWADFHFYPNNIIYKEPYYRCSDAIAAYLQAIQLSKDKELLAKCLLMLNYCDNRRHESDNYFAHPSWWAGKEKPYTSPWLRRLRREYNQTDFYKKCSTTCPDITELAKK